MSRHPLKTFAAAACMVALTACGGGGDDASPPAADPLAGVPENAQTSPSRFIAYVRSLVASQGDGAEPFPIDGVKAPANDRAEPEPQV